MVSGCFQGRQESPVSQAVQSVGGGGDFAGCYAAHAWQTDLYLFYFLIFGPSKDKSSQVHCDCYFCNLAD